jgi:hypothetical protein
MTPTQEDREAAESLAAMICGCADARQRRGDVDQLLAYRQAAEERGARMALEAAAKVAEQWCEENKASAADAERQGNRGFAAELRTAATECDAFADHIRQIDPASLGAE